MDDRTPQGLEKLLHITVNLRGEEKRATLTACVLDEEARLKRSRALVEAAGESTFDELPAASRLRLYMLVTVRLSLLDIPQWLDRWLGMHDDLVFSLYREVDTLERDYFRGFMGESESDAGGPLFRIDARPSPSTP